MNRSIPIYTLISLFTLVVSITFIWLVPMSNLEYASLMCANFLMVLYFTWKTDRMSPFFFFLATFTFLFIGGRFWAELILPHHFSMRRGNFFDETKIADPLWFQSLTYILVFLYSATIAYINYPRKNKDKPTICYKRQERLSIDRFLMVVFWLLAPFVLYDVGSRLLVALTEGYLSLYAMQTENVAAGSGLVASMLYVFFGIAFVYGNHRTKKAFMLLMFAKAFVFILIGQRAKFGSLLLFFMWYYFRDKKVNVLKMALMVGVSLFLLIWLASISLRYGAGIDLTAPFQVLARFFYSQGVSLTTFTCSQKIDSYPALPYFVSFIPGMASIVSMFSAIPPQDASFAHYLAYSLDEGLYNSGHGLGWTLLSDIYLYSGRTYILFALLSALFGSICARVEDKSKTSRFAAVVVFTVFLNLTFLPRAGLYTIIPLIVWTGLVYAFMNTTSRVFREAQQFAENNTEAS